MTITLEINNPFYLDGLEDMAEAAHMDAASLCAAIVTRRIESYVQIVAQHRENLVRSFLPHKMEEDEA